MEKYILMIFFAKFFFSLQKNDGNGFGKTSKFISFLYSAYQEREREREREKKRETSVYI